VSDKFADELARASRHLDPGFGSRDVESGLSSLERRIASRRRRKHAALGLSAAALALLAAIQWRGQERLPLTATGTRALTTQDGSVATLGDAQTSLAVTHDAPDEVALELDRGRGHFAVTPNPKRRYRVHVGQVEVEVLGTSFEIERRAEHVSVRVEHGVVRVGWAGGSTTLRAGQSGTFPPPSAARPSDEPAPAVTPEPSAPQPKRAAREREAWRALARAGKHEEAFGSLGKQPVEDLAGLLLAADAARLSGHPRDAARYLEHLVERYPESPSAPLAAFTLGRLTLYELRQPALAAAGFARAYALAPNGPMAEDALAREAEAYHQAGDVRRTKSAAQRYLARYPNGARREELARYLAPR
jgi:transmembrane sensor